MSTNKKAVPFENQLDLATMVRVAKGGHVAGAYLLNKVNSKGGSKDELQLIFGFSCEGIHPWQRPGLEKAIAKKLLSGFKEIPQGERFIFRWSSFSAYADAKQYLEPRIHNACSVESQFMDCATLGRIQQLALEHRRNKITLNIYCTFTLNSLFVGGDALDRGVASSIDLWQRHFQKLGSEITQKRLIDYLSKAIDASKRYQQILTGMGLRPVVKDEHLLWRELAQRMGAKPTTIPHTLVYDEQGLREEFPAYNTHYSNPVQVIPGDHLHAASRLLNNGVPFADRCWVRRGDKYVAVMTLASKPAGFDGDMGQIRFLWDVFSRQGIFDVEVITEVAAANKASARSAQQFLTRYSITRSKNVQKLGSLDVSAQINLDRSAEAQRRLYTGDCPVHVAIAILVYRNSPSELDDACREIANYIYDPASLVRETEYAWLPWLQTLMVTRDALFLRPFNRRLTFFASEVAGVTNLVSVSQFDQKGFELIAEEGGVPVKINVAKTDTAMNMLVLGTTGAGKSLLVAQIINECLAEDMSFLILDLPNDDGTGTFDSFTPYYEGAYFDISKESINILEPLNTENVPDEVKNERIQMHRADVILIVTQLVLGSSSLDGFLVDTIESLIPLGIAAFYNDPAIQQRFDAAQSAKIGSLAWANTPTLVDLERYFSRDYIAADYKDDDQQRALNHIRLRLQYWFSSAISNAICRPSSFRSEQRLITFALTNIQTGKEAEVFALTAYIAASRQSLSTSKSALFMDEASVLLKYPAFAQLIGRKCATARKSGSRTILAGQDIISIVRCSAGEQIIQNMQCILIGKIASGAARSISEVLNLTLETVEQNQSFAPDRVALYTRWLVYYNNKYAFCRYYAPYPTIGLTANSREEQAARNRFKQEYPNKFQWLPKFSQHYVGRVQKGDKL